MLNLQVPVNDPAAPEAHGRDQLEAPNLRFSAGRVQQINQTTQVSVADFSAGAGLLASARNDVGGPASVVTDRSIITDPETGQEMRVATAVTLGLLQRDAQGNYRESGRTLLDEAPRAAAQESPYSA